MNSEQFSGFLNFPGALNAQSLPVITELVKEYPYFQTAHILLARNLFNEKHIRYNAQLKIAAAYASDRTRLYELINGPVKPEKLVQPEQVKTEPLPEQTGQKPVEAAIIEKPVEQKEEKKEVQVVAEKPITKQEEKKELPAEPEKPVQKSILKPVEEPSKEKPVTEIKKEQKPEPIVKKQASKTDEKHTFTEWLKLAAIHSVTGIEIEREKKKPLPNEDLIEKFIREEPRISKPQKTEFFSPANMARQSVVEDNELVTETLAAIYEKQGFYAKAIKAYEKLSLKYPEKKLSFAARIENLRQKLNEQ